ncbi:hypothetical protein HMPREF1624_06911 [Sporothrix schenckii ATCC 58251]|uniref:Cytochrome P450 monooxygenase n=1 Tax=Sporothrix schenckii (strain ATCC 58251 / de Perez 2211183) TaxID=1391915 RepID=U7PMA6_SPOS1|nr:hypothetical protein HMPREF1624_06911 [Sporothrix schenckii ATCC 58251]
MIHSMIVSLPVPSPPQPTDNTDIPYAIAALVVVALVYPLVVFFVDRHGLRKYPAPSIAAYTPLWQMYHNYVGRKYLAVDRAHRQLGPVVRLGPTHLSFSSPRAYRAIYGHGTSIVKDAFYDNQAAGNPNMADVTDRAVHRGKRKNLSFVFAAKQIVAMEPRVAATVAKLVAALRIKAAGGQVSPRDRFAVGADGVFDVRPWLNMFAYDAITSVVWSQTYGFLDRGDDDCSAQDADGTVHTVQAMHTFHTGAAWSVCLGHLAPRWYALVKGVLLSWTAGRRCGDDFSGMARHLAVQRLARTADASEAADLFAHLPVTATAARPAPMPFDEIVAESTVMLNAGNDTTQSALTNTVYCLARHRDKQATLRAALRAAHTTGGGVVVDYATLQRVPYLRAVLDEALRLHPPLGTGAPRRTTAPTTIDGTIDGQPVPAGVTVSAQTWSLHRNAALFRDATAFCPERWLPGHPEYSDQERQHLQDYVAPFSMGPRACIGRNLAYMELSLCVAALVLAFDWRLPDPDYVLRHHERFNCNPVELPVKVTPLEGV